MKKENEIPEDFTFEDQNVWTELRDGNVVLHTTLSNCGSDSYDRDLSEWFNHEQECVLISEFQISGIIDGVIDMHGLVSYKGAIDLKVKPLVDALRAEFVKQIERIDAMVFKESTYQSTTPDE